MTDSNVLSKIQLAGKKVGFRYGINSTADFIVTALEHLNGLGSVEMNHTKEYGYTISCLTSKGIIGNAVPRPTIGEALADTVLSEEE